MDPTATARILAGTSILGLSVAVAATVLGHIGLGPDFNPLALTLSDYALSDRGAAIEAAMVTLACASLALLAGLAAAHAPVRGIPTVLLLVWAAGLLLAAVVPTDPIGTPVLSTAGYVHRYASVTAFLCLPVAALMMASRFATEPAWRALSPVLRRLAGASGVGLALLFYVAFPGDRVLMGLVERALIAVEVVVLLLLALRLLLVGSAVRAVLIPPPQRQRTSVYRPAGHSGHRVDPLRQAPAALGFVSVNREPSRECLSGDSRDPGQDTHCVNRKVLTSALPSPSISLLQTVR